MKINYAKMSVTFMNSLDLFVHSCEKSLAVSSDLSLYFAGAVILSLKGISSSCPHGLQCNRAMRVFVFVLFFFKLLLLTLPQLSEQVLRKVSRRDFFTYQFYLSQNNHYQNNLNLQRNESELVIGRLLQTELIVDLFTGMQIVKFTETHITT